MLKLQNAESVDMASALIAEKDREGPAVPCPSASAIASPSRRRRFSHEGNHSDLDVLLRKAGLAVVDASAGGELGREEDSGAGAAGMGSRRPSDSDCRVGQCRMPGPCQRLATIRSFTAMCCALAALTGTLKPYVDDTCVS